MPSPDATAPRVRHSDTHVDHRQGRLFARVWDPTDAEVGSTGATPIVLLHDSLGCVELWRDFPGRLSAATGRRVIAYDRAGFGRSEPRREPPTLDFIAEEARDGFAAVLEGFDLDRFILFGHSVGGCMGVHCAAAYPDRCEVFVSESAQMFPEALTLESIARARAQFREPGQLERLAKYHGERAQWVLDAWTETWLDPAFASWTLEPVLPSVTCPVLAIHGGRDEYGSTRHAGIIARLAGGPARAKIMEKAGHLPHREDAVAVADIVRDFIADAAGGGANVGVGPGRDARVES